MESAVARVRSAPARSPPDVSGSRDLGTWADYITKPCSMITARVMFRSIAAPGGWSGIMKVSSSKAKAGHQRIFVSYARRDGAELARRLQNALTTAGFDFWLDTQRIAGGASWTVE